jgi:hypothetical protein
MLVENAFRRGAEPTIALTTISTAHAHREQHRATCSASPMDDRSPLASPSRVVTGFAASAASSYDGGGGGGGGLGVVVPGAPASPPPASPPLASPRARAVARALLGEALDADAKTRSDGGLGGEAKGADGRMDDSVKSDGSAFADRLCDDLDDDDVGGRPRSRVSGCDPHEDDERHGVVVADGGGFARSSPIDIPTWDRKPAHWKTCV